MSMCPGLLYFHELPLYEGRKHGQVAHKGFCRYGKQDKEHHTLPGYHMDGKELT